MEIENRCLESYYRRCRRRLLALLYSAQSGHPGGALSSLHYLTYLAYNELIDLEKDFPFNDRPFILSPGHYCPALYSVMVESGILKESDLAGYRTVECKLHGHPIRSQSSKVYYTSGSLGQGLSLAIGIAKYKKDSKVHVLMSDGEINEGQTWEAMLYMVSESISNVILTFDMNGFQLDGATCDILRIKDFRGTLEKVGFNVYTCNGNSHRDIESSYSKMMSNKGISVLLLNTIIGYGVAEIQGQAIAHGCKISSSMVCADE